MGMADSATKLPMTQTNVELQQHEAHKVEAAMPRQLAVLLITTHVAQSDVCLNFFYN